MAVRYWLPFIVFSCAFLFLVATMNRSVTPYDEGLILFGSTRVLSGDIPYRDFYANYGPGQFYVLAALFKVFGPSRSMQAASRYPCCQLSRCSSRPGPRTICSSISF
jgi:hypothetical protein